MPTYSILLSGALAAQIKKVLVISWRLAGPTTLLGKGNINLSIAHRYDSLTITTARSSSPFMFSYDGCICLMLRVVLKDTQNREGVCLVLSWLVRRRQSALVWCEVSFFSSERPTYMVTEGRQKSGWRPSSVISV